MNSTYLTQVTKVFPPVGNQGRSHGTPPPRKPISQRCVFFVCVFLFLFFCFVFCLFVCLFLFCFNEYEYIAEVKISFLCDFGGKTFFPHPVLINADCCFCFCFYLFVCFYFYNCAGVEKYHYTYDLFVEKFGTLSTLPSPSRSILQ